MKISFTMSTSKRVKETIKFKDISLMERVLRKFLQHEIRFFFPSFSFSNLCTLLCENSKGKNFIWRTEKHKDANLIFLTQTVICKYKPSGFCGLSLKMIRN